MEIIYKDKRKVYFEMVAIGDVFSYNGSLYMSTQEAASTSTGELCNAVSMRDGETSYFEARDEVALVKAQLVIS